MLGKWLCVLAGWLAWCLSAQAGGELAMGDAVRGKALYVQCIGCHSPQWNRTGPRHCGLPGRAAGTVPGFNYSNAMQHADFIWTMQTLNDFLAAPMDYVPGTRMAVAGIQSDQDRQDVIAYLIAMNKLAECQGGK